MEAFKFVTQQFKLAYASRRPKFSDREILNPWDTPMSNEEEKYWEMQEKLHEDIINKLN